MDKPGSWCQRTRECIGGDGHKGPCVPWYPESEPIERLRASTPEGSETEDRTMDGCDPVRATYTRAISPPSHDVEALRNMVRRWCSASRDLDPASEVALAGDALCNYIRALSTHVGDEG